MTILHLAQRFTEAMDISRRVDRVDCVDMRIMCEGHASRFKSCQPTEVARADHGCHLLACIDSSVGLHDAATVYNSANRWSQD